MNPEKSYLSYLKQCLTAFGISMPISAMAEWSINLPKGVTPVSRDIYDLHMLTMAICAGIGLIVYSFLIFILFRYRRSRGAKPTDFDNNSTLENIWTVTPFLILVAMAIPSTLVLIDMEDESNADITIKITGSQWQWHYAYLDKDIEFYSRLSTPTEQIHGHAKKGEWYLLEVDKPLVLPVHQKVRFLVTSDDVIHSWWVPELGVKRDAIPGYIHESWAKILELGIYRGQCAELCGVDHAFMPIVVKAVTEQEFTQWLAQQNKPPHPEETVKWKMDTEMRKGREHYMHYCAACHQEDGSGIPPLFPALTTSSVVVGKPISRHIDLVLQGVPGSAMPAFAGQLSNAEIAAIITYERNAWDHDTGDLITPEQVQMRRSK
ncbi:cytochrome B559 subunit alpha [Methyloprofundus sedimenti]|uniref:Cytochrome c oxidase subunit 2 n=2 Tax=Methyloprofundus sedimenti TaxID=1420851 RepID=A0A1V8M2E5_9GAMM|nr:cytochrome B559 subunit alpha [Methyloprofundus sedimenti]